MEEEIVLDFTKICRVCMDEVNEGLMMSLSKVNLSKKIMTCCNVQIRQGDSLPEQICNKCLAKLHISFQFKKQCEKTDLKLRQLLSKATVDDLIEEKFTPQTPFESQEDIEDLKSNLELYIKTQDTVINSQITSDKHLQNTTDDSLQETTPLELQEMTSKKLSQEEMLSKPMKETDEHASKLGYRFKLKQLEECSTCGRGFSSSGRLLRHVKIAHTNKNKYQCKICNKEFTHHGNYKVHLRVHTDERPFTCTICERGFKQLQDVEKHVRIHTGEKPHKCSFCNKGFSSQSNLAAHVRIHTGDKPYVCCICQKSFCQSNELTKHMRTHTGEKSHVCSVCNKGFNGSSMLRAHTLTHTREKPYICVTCKKGFFQMNRLTEHMKQHTGEGKVFMCLLCKLSFVTKTDLAEHSLVHDEDSYQIVQTD